MKYKVGDRVKIKSLDWYNDNKDKHGNVPTKQYSFNSCNKHLCGTILTIKRCFHDCYLVEENKAYWTDDMIEGLVEEETKKEDVAWMYDGKLVAERFSDEVTIKVPKYNKLSINTELCDDKIELVISPDFELKQEGNKWFAVKKKKEYPKTYEECCKVMNYCCNPVATKTTHKEELIRRFQFLLMYRDAYWQIAGEEMGLGKPWKPDWEDESDKFTIGYFYNDIDTDIIRNYKSYPLAFPTKEMRDAFYENFKELIEQCKELL